MQKHDDITFTNSYVGFHDDMPVPSTYIDNMANDFVNNTFANTVNSEEDIYPATVSQIAAEQRKDTNIGRYFKKDIEVDQADPISLKVIDETKLLLYKGTRLVIPSSLQSEIVTWYHHYLLHPSHTRLEETIAISMYWRSLHSDVR